MKKLLLTSLILLTVQFLAGQISAVTGTGDEVLLYDDGTWKYVDGITDEAEILVNDQVFKKDESSTFLVSSKKLNVGVWIDPKSWSFVKGTGDDAQEFQFQKKGEDLYGMMIAEKMQIPIETLKGIAIENARGVAPDLKVIKEEYRKVNGTTVLMMQMAGTIQGVKFTYYGYYYSNDQGSVQFLTYTGENLLDDYLDDIELFLNGFVEL